ncbi:hypothetical protein BT96DRAFT_933075 [Gymnopus androsaceus JB14]|uniref:Uncharacterized protein n=1 Tax=Gymnopus androsaceus JB14 TaxID=1447944 RepID=A0A6A4IEB7_9AGAR|nr:hypothetical protein BT96DRAFT_933075 [Gymnopus androsaceus JB14]
MGDTSSRPPQTLFIASSSIEAAESRTFFIDMEAKEDDNEVNNGRWKPRVLVQVEREQECEKVLEKRWKSVVYFTVPVIPGETELTFETRIYKIQERICKKANKEMLDELTVLTLARRAAAAAASATTPAASTSAPAPLLLPRLSLSELLHLNFPALSPPALKVPSFRAWLPPGVDEMAFGAPTPDAGSPIVLRSPLPNYRNNPFNLSSLPKIQLEDLSLVQTLIVAPVSLWLGLTNQIADLVNFANEDLPQEETLQHSKLVHSEPMIHCLTQGWQIAARFLNGKINSLPLAKIKLKKHINNFNPVELANQMQDLGLMIKSCIKVCTLADEASGLVADVRMTIDGLEEKDNGALASVADVRMARGRLEEEEDED